jgi:hypothetical protein
MSPIQKIILIPFLAFGVFCLTFEKTEGCPNHAKLGSNPKSPQKPIAQIQKNNNLASQKIMVNKSIAPNLNNK